MKISKKIVIALILIICTLICSKVNSVFIEYNYITNEKLSYKRLSDGTSLIYGFDIGTKISDILSGNFVEDYNVKVFDSNDVEISNLENTIATGYKINLYNKDESEDPTLIKNYTVVLYGDVNGDTSVNSADALSIVKNKLGTITISSEEYVEAGRITSNTRTNSTIPSSIDALAIIKYKLEPETYPINQQIINSTDNKETTETPVALHGQLSVSGTNIVDENGDNFQLKGVSTHGIGWYPQYVNQDAFEFMRDDWNINVVRLAMYSNPSDGYSRDNWATVKNGVDYATNAGLYVIIDWHILNDNNPNTYKSEAIEFFKEMATTYKDNKNVLYEICNEPNGDVTWERDIKPYAEEVIAKIREIDNDAIIICGTPTWSQDVDIVSQSPITDYDNIVYTLHFYAATHKEDLRTKLTTAINNGLPVFVSEFGICDSYGSGTIDETEANTWIDLLNQNNISWVCWNLSNKDEASSIISSSTDKVTDWTDEELSQTGKWLKSALKGAK